MIINGGKNDVPPKECPYCGEELTLDSESISNNKYRMICICENLDCDKEFVWRGVPETLDEITEK